MDEQEKQAMLHHEALQKQAANQQKNGGISGAIDEIRHQVVEEPYWLRPEGRATSGDIEPKVRDFYATPDVQEHDNGGMEAAAEPSAEQIQDTADEFFDIDRVQEAEQSRAQETERDIGL